MATINTTTTILETKLIHPSQPPFTGDHTLSLSHLDNDRNLRVSFRYLRAYVANHINLNHPFHVISAAIAVALSRYYPLAGTLRRRADNRLELFCSTNLSLPVIHAQVDCTLESVNFVDHDVDPDFVEVLVPDPDQETGLVNPCVLQVTVFKCGGFTLGAAIYHALCDGMGATQFFNVAAEVARGVEIEKVSFHPVWDRTGLLGPRDVPRAEGPVREFLRLDKEYEPYSEGVGDVVVGREGFEVNDECLDELKKVLFDESGGKNFTTFEALGAFIWRAKVKAAEIPGQESVKFAYSVNIRKVVKPPLPTGYWGNGCVPMYAQLSAEELTNQPLWKTAESIKKSKINVNDDYVRSFIDFQELHYVDGITAGKNVSGFTDWRHLGHSTVDFGWGGPVTVLPLSRHLLGSVEPCFFLPYSSAKAGQKDGFKVQVTLSKKALPSFSEEMSKFSNKEFDI
ncbi:hypothetical protein ACFE04_018667 [Oxalis oulophora]